MRKLVLTTVAAGCLISTVEPTAQADHWFRPGKQVKPAKLAKPVKHAVRSNQKPHRGGVLPRSRVLVVVKLNNSLAGTPLRGLGELIEQIGWQRNVNPYVLVAISGKESSYGAQACYANRYNIWGLGACDRAWSPPRFRSWEHAFDYFATFLRQTWPSARIVDELYGYCSGCMGEWAAGVRSLLYSFGSGGEIAYR